jgi:hypothetical protein
MKIFSACALATFAIAATAADRMVLPPETAVFRPGGGIELAQANCLICHSVEYIQTQPPMPRKFWEAEVKKMREKYAAPTPEEAVAALVDYLTATYGTPEPRKP